MLRAIGIALSMWVTSTALMYVHYRYCFPWYTFTEPCICIQRSSLFLNSTLKNYCYLVIGIGIDTILKLMPPLMRKAIDNKSEL